MKDDEAEIEAGRSNMAQVVALSEKEQFLSLVSHVQRGRMDEQRCYLDLSKRTTATSQNSNTNTSAQDPDQFFKLVANSQGRRLDDQRVSLNSLPGLRTSATNQSGVNKPAADGEANQKYSTAHKTGMPTVEQDEFLSLISHVQRGRMDEQRCNLDLNKRAPTSYKETNAGLSDKDADHLFQLLANTQSNRLDDQRVSLNALPRTQTNSSSGQRTMTEKDSENMYNMLFKVQGSRMDEQRCSAPGIQLGTPAHPRKAYTRPSSPTLALPESDSSSKSPRRSQSFTPASEVERPQSNANHTTQDGAEQDRLFAMIHNVQRGRMEDQRCSFEPIRKSPSTPNQLNVKPTAEDAEQFFKLFTNSHSRRLDDQRVSLNSLPGLQSSSGREQKERSKSSTTQKSDQLCHAASRLQTPMINKPRFSAPQIILTPGSPVPDRRASSRPESPTQSPPDSPIRAPPRSASFSPMSDSERMHYDVLSPTQMTFQVSMCFTPQQGRKGADQLCSYPEVFLTLGPPGEAIVVPLSPVPGTPVSVSVTPSIKPHPRLPSPTRRPRSRASSQSPTPTGTSPISPDEDYFSLIHRIHSAQLQRTIGQGAGEKEKADSGRGKGKGKGNGKRERKEGGKKR